MKFQLQVFCYSNTEHTNTPLCVPSCTKENNNRNVNYIFLFDSKVTTISSLHSHCSAAQCCPSTRVNRWYSARSHAFSNPRQVATFSPLYLYSRPREPWASIPQIENKILARIQFSLNSAYLAHLFKFKYLITQSCTYTHKAIQNTIWFFGEKY